MLLSQFLQSFDFLHELLSLDLELCYLVGHVEDILLIEHLLLFLQLCHLSFVDLALLVRIL